jgi:hypothetical protein
MTKERPYQVGYGRPPEHSRFAKGQSGNPAGRPKGSRAISAVIASALAERVTVTEGGRRRSITKLDAAVKQMANKAAGGDQRAAKLIIELLHSAETRDDLRNASAPATSAERAAADRAILEALRERVLSVGTADDPDR